MTESKIRSWTKSFTWRILGIAILLALGYLFTGSVTKASLITFTFHFIRVILYYVHERVWERIDWWRGGEPDDKLWFYITLGLLIVTFVIVGVLSL